MKKQKVIVRPPVLQIKFGRFRLEAKGVAGEVDNIEELRELVQKPFHDLFEDLNKLLQERLEVSILTEGGNEVIVPIEPRSEWQGVPSILEKQIEKYEGKMKTIIFGSETHGHLWTINKKGPQYGDTKRNQTFWAAGFVEPVLGASYPQFQITVAGKQFLAQLYKKGPRGKRGELAMTRGLLIIARVSYRPTGPIYDYLLDHGYIEQGETSFLLTDKAKDYLEEVGIRYTHHSSMYSRERVELVAFLPREALNEFLASDDISLREAAQKRMQQLEAEVPEQGGVK